MLTSFSTFIASFESATIKKNQERNLGNRHFHCFSLQPMYSEPNYNKYLFYHCSKFLPGKIANIQNEKKLICKCMIYLIMAIIINLGISLLLHFLVVYEYLEYVLLVGEYVLYFRVLVVFKDYFDLDSQKQNSLARST